MAQETALQVIELQQLPIIVERLHSVKADIEQRTADALSLVCTEQTYKSVKDARAQLTKEFKEWIQRNLPVLWTAQSKKPRNWASRRIPRNSWLDTKKNGPNDQKEVMFNAE